MLNIVDSLDDLESKLYEDKIYIKFALDKNEMLSWLQEDVDIIEAYVGKEFFKEEEVFNIKKTKLIEIEERLKEVLTAKEFKNVLPIIKSLGYKSVKDILKNYPTYVEKLSERCNKSINPMEITGDDILVDTTYYRKIGKVLVHIFRNCVDHGIEPEDERLEKGKEQFGTISCHIQDMKESLKIIISDNGRGIDTEGLVRKCIGLGLYTEEQIMSMTDKEKLNLVFEQGISTKEVATTISGRGVGMASVKECVQDMGGYIELESKKDAYTRFIITVPKVEENENIEITAEAFMKAMVTTTEDIVLRHTGINMNSSGIEVKNLIELSKITALINLKGSINSIVMISANESMSRRLVEGFILEPLKDEEKEEYAEAVIGEICNNILGNTFGIFEDMDSIFHIGIPAMISNNGAYVKYTDSEIVTAALTYEDYVFNISMLAVQNEERDFSKGDLVWQEY